MPMHPVFRRSIFNKERALPRMSWSHENLYNIWQRVSPDGPLTSETNFTRTSMTLYQQRWRSKRLGRGYHGDHIDGKKFERWYVPDALPSIHASSSSATPSSTTTPTTTTGGMDRSRLLSTTVPSRSREGGRKQLTAVRTRQEIQGRASVGTMLYREVERRVDVLVFRACLATSVWQARSWVVHGRVRVNGLVESNPNTRLHPGDIFSVDPSIIPMLSEAEAGRAERKLRERERETKKSRRGGAGVMDNGKGKGKEESAEGLEADEAGKAREDVEGEKAGSSSSESPALDGELTTSTATSETSPAPKPIATTTPTETPGKPLAFFTLPPFAAPHLFIPAYLEVSFKTCSAVYVRHPTARAGYSEIPSPYDADGEVMSLGWEWFKRKAPNMTKRRHRWMDPERSNDRK